VLPSDVSSAKEKGQHKRRLLAALQVAASLCSRQPVSLPVHRLFVIHSLVLVGAARYCLLLASSGGARGWSAVPLWLKRRYCVRSARLSLSSRFAKHSNKHPSCGAIRATMLVLTAPSRVMYISSDESQHDEHHGTRSRQLHARTTVLPSTSPCFNTTILVTRQHMAAQGKGRASPRSRFPQKGLQRALNGLRDPLRVVPALEPEHHSVRPKRRQEHLRHHPEVGRPETELPTTQPPREGVARS
jgi:hypothetical protein